jgi:hypothetical protein
MYDCSSRPGNPFRAIKPFTMIPVGAIGESAPALAPLPTIIAMRNTGIPVRAAVAIASGASSAAVAMLPGPIEAIATPSTKNITGIVPRFPRQSRTAWCARRSSVPFDCAIANSSVTPVKVKNSWLGNPLMIVVTGMPPM